MLSETETRSEDWRRRSTWLAVLVVLASLALYTMTLAPGLLWGGGDFARNQTWAYEGRVDSVDLISHPLWVYLAHVFVQLPLRDPAWRANFASAVFASLTLLFVFLSATSITRKPRLALLGTAALAVSHTFWTYAVLPKAFSLNTLFVAACCYLLLRWREKRQWTYLYVCAALFGLSLFNHILMVTAAAGMVVFIGMVARSQPEMKHVGRAVILAVALLCAGAAPFGYVLLSGLNASSGFGGGVFVRTFAGLVYPLTHPAALAMALGWGIPLAIYQFPFTFLVGLLGLARLWRTDRALFWLIVLVVAGTTAFMVANTDPSISGLPYFQNLHFYLPAYVALSLGFASGFEVLFNGLCANKVYCQGLAVLLAVALPVAVYVAAPPVARLVLKDVPGARAIGDRDNFVYLLSPWKQGETGARAFAEQTLAVLPPRSVLFAEYGIWWPVRYLQVVEKARPDVTIVNPRAAPKQVPEILQYRDGRDLFIGSDTYWYYDIEGIKQYFDIVPAGPVFRLVAKSSP